MATARAGNVFGGGDWSAHRLIPDLLAAFAADQTATLRSPQSVRPWQHVLEPLAGYLVLAEKIFTQPEFARAWNFGPGEQDCLSTEEIAQKLANLWGPNAHWQSARIDFPHEAGLLRLDASQARQQLDWQPRWSLIKGLQATVGWHRAWLNGNNMRTFTQQQINEFSAHAAGH